MSPNIDIQHIFFSSSESSEWKNAVSHLSIETLIFLSIFVRIHSEWSGHRNMFRQFTFIIPLLFKVYRLINPLDSDAFKMFQLGNVHGISPINSNEIKVTQINSFHKDLLEFKVTSPILGLEAWIRNW